MTAMAVTLVGLLLLVAAVVVFVAWRDRNRLSSDEDPGAVLRAGAEQDRHEAERHIVQGQAASRNMPNNSM
ncbi:hypothetical protein Q2K19_15620 [Micromonospora soli]|uniref:hypothetical protein n=1 Tax=Micromonospora sp. NBRC 110009 TaxID=3061627 RepID=UPI002672E4CC|nr:hypothetical protein [Micromonospora sp. NBRC 110009]WKU01798.1 hypothetical protein Q2K19_15620 [Micromonospora sp. NBRC 110009]